MIATDGVLVLLHRFVAMVSPTTTPALPASSEPTLKTALMASACHSQRVLRSLNRSVAMTSSTAPPALPELTERATAITACVWILHLQQHQNDLGTTHGSVAMVSPMTTTAVPK